MLEPDLKDFGNCSKGTTQEIPLTIARAKNADQILLQESKIMLDTSAIETALKAIGLLGAGIGWAYNVRATMLRGKVKTDLEILEKSRALFGQDDERSKRIEENTSQLVGYLYRKDGQRPRYGIHWSDFVLGLFCLAGSSTFGWRGAHQPSMWQLVVGGILGFVALGAFLNAFDTKRSGHKGMPEASRRTQPAVERSAKQGN